MMMKNEHDLFRELSDDRMRGLRKALADWHFYPNPDHAKAVEEECLSVVKLTNRIASMVDKDVPTS